MGEKQDEPDFTVYGYKLFMTFGLLAENIEKAQTRVGDRQGIVLILENAFIWDKEKGEKFVKWGLWALFVSI